MKKLNYKYLVIVMLIALVSCDDKLNLVDPVNADQAIVYSTDQNVKAALTGTYDILSAASLFGGKTLRNSELLGANGEITFEGTYNEPKQMFNKAMITTNPDVSDFWLASYEAINRSNDIINALDVVNEADRNQVKGEALFIRGLVYFELVKYFGQPFVAGNVDANEAVPLLLKPYSGLADAYLARASVGAVYKQVVEDLTMAAALLEEGTDNTRGSGEAALGILSRVYLQMEDYEKARDAANTAISTANFMLLADYANVFNGESTDEDIFNIPVSVNDGTNEMQTYYASTEFGGRGDIAILPAHIAQYEQDDRRLELFYVDNVSANQIRSGKWINPYGNVKVLRYAELLLTRAEANQQLSQEVGASPLEDVNAIRARAELAPLASVDLAAIQHERMVELAHEGHKIHDFKRWRKPVVEGAITYPFDSPKLIFPIPQRERNVNPNLTQNEGYGSN